MGWYDQKHIFSDKKNEYICEICGSKFWIPKCKKSIYKTCSNECANERESKIHKELLEFRKKECKQCGTTFFPRKEQIKNGIGIFCSINCSVKNVSIYIHSKESREKASIKRKKSFLDGKWVGLKGEKNPRWIGGPEFHKKKAPEEINSLRRAYLKNNPDKAREFRSKRNGKKIGSLPKGTINKIGNAQRWLCVICRTTIKNNFHADHINPISKGGKHEFANIQLLCPKCNLKKSAKDPIEYMQSQGFLL